MPDPAFHRVRQWTASIGAGSFQGALVIIGVATLAAMVAMAVVMAMALARADDLLERLRRSQDQLAQVTRIQADVNALRADVAAGAPDLAARMRSVDADLAAYRRSVADEGRALGAGSDAGQAGEASNAERLVEMFAGLREPLLRGAPGPTERQAQRRFEALADQVVEREREEARMASLAMGELRRTITVLAVAIPALVGLLGAAGAWIMLASVVRPLRALEAAALSSADAKVQGFSEFRRLAGAFNRMRAQIARQRATLEAANQDLEHQVRARTAEIEAGRQALAEIDANRRLFFSKIGHELRTPATVIRGEAEVALRDPGAPPERLREALRIVAANSQLLSRRMDDMLTLARAEDGRLALRRERVDLAEVARQAVALAEPYVRANGLELAADVGGAGATLDGDASWLQQAILAVVDNAAKFADDREPIRLTVSRDRTRARIVVADSGPGVAGADLPHLFDSWYQTPSGRARGGSGLGLSVARWVVEQHGGEIRAQSSPGKGLTVEIELPVTP